jgi:transcriptional regulator with XRE-family HTH domain
MNANRQLKENLDALLRKHHKTHKDLAQWCRMTESWISKIFKEERREFSVKILGRIADLFGLEAYQLFIPGIVRATERRKGERRSGRERRTSFEERLMLGLAEEIAPYRKAGPHVATSSPFAEELRRLSERHEREISTLLSRAESRGQAATPRRAQPKASKGRGDAGGRDADPAGKG